MITSVKTYPHFELAYSATSVERMTSGETPDLYHLMLGIVRVRRPPLKVI